MKKAILSKGQRTRLKIIAAAAPIFNRKGYAGTSIDDVLKATGLQKGGLYRHFKSKEELALESFEYAVRLVGKRYTKDTQKQKTPKGEILAMIDQLPTFMSHPPLPGGCPFLNTGLESDEASPTLIQHVQQAMTQWRDFLVQRIQAGQDIQEINAAISPVETANLLVMIMEGALFFGQLYKDPSYIDQAATHLRQIILQL